MPINHIIAIVMEVTGDIKSTANNLSKDDYVCPFFSTDVYFTKYVHRKVIKITIMKCDASQIKPKFRA